MFEVAPKLIVAHATRVDWLVEDIISRLRMSLTLMVEVCLQGCLHYLLCYIRTCDHNFIVPRFMAETWQDIATVRVE